MRKLTILLFALMVFSLPFTAMAGDVPDLKGTWVGPSIGVKHGTGDLKAHKGKDALGKVNEIEMTLTIDSVEKGVFQGTHKSANNEERVIGVVCPDTGMIFMVDEDSYYSGKVLGDDKIQMVWMEVHPGKSHGIAMTLYTRQK